MDKHKKALIDDFFSFYIFFLSLSHFVYSTDVTDVSVFNVSAFDIIDISTWFIAESR